MLPRFVETVHIVENLFHPDAVSLMLLVFILVIRHGHILLRIGGGSRVNKS